MATVGVVAAMVTGTAGAGAAVAVAPQQTTTTVAVSDREVYLGTPVTVTATVTAAAGVPSGSVTFTVIGTDWVERAVPLVDGVATLVVDDLVPGPNRVAANYPGADGFAPSEDWSYQLFVDVAEFVPPVVTSLSPEVVAAGETVHIYGSHFRDASVTFGGVPVTPVQIASYFVAVKVPVHSSTGSVPVVVTTPAGTSTTVALTIVDTTGGIVAQTPVRIHSGPGNTDGSTCLQVAGKGTVPAGASGVILNVTTTRVWQPGYVVVFPDTLGSEPVPSTSTVNFEPGSDVANTAFVALPNGRICYRTSTPQVQVLLDVTGFTMADSGIELRAPVRLLDTRTSGPVPAGSVQTVQVSGRAGVPSDAAAVIVNATVTGITGVGNLRVFPAGQPVPNASVVNYAPGKDKANSTIVTLPSSGKLSFLSDTGGSTAHVILDVAGYVTAGGAYQGVTPTRVLDTRPGRVGGLDGPLQPRTAYTVELPSTMVPSGATSVVLNVTAIAPPSLGHLRVYPSASGAVVPWASTLNYIPGRDIPNLVVVALPDSGPATVKLYSDMVAPRGTVHIAADVAGFVVAP